jgi:hypothetical protein
MGLTVDDARRRIEAEFTDDDDRKEERRRRVTFLSMIIGLASAELVS